MTHYIFAVLWAACAAMQISLGVTDGDRFTVVLCVTLSGLSLGMSVFNFIKAAGND